MIVVTGAAGFIGSQIIRGLNAQGVSNILAVGDLTDGKKFYNLVDCDYLDFMDYEVFLSYIQGGERWSDPIEAMFHEGACSDTTEWDGRYMMRNNYEYTKILFHYCLDRQIPFLYASSAAVYGSSTAFKESETQQRPLNVYGYSKWAFDQYMLRHLPRAQSQVVGFRYFNVYGPHEQHKGRMASVAFHFMNQLREQNAVRLFEGSHGYENGEQLRDFVSVADVVRVNLWFLRHPEKSGIFNLGTGKARSFNDVARILIDLHGRGRIQYIPFPDALKSAYQSFTQADLSALRAIGYTADFDPIEVGLADYHAYQTDRCRVELLS